MHTTMSRTAPVTICAMRSTRRNCATNSVGGLGIVTSSRACRRLSSGIATTRTGGRRPKTPQKRSTPDSGNDGGAQAMTELRQDVARDRHAYSGADGVGAARSRRQPRVVQGELAARENGGRRNAGLRAGTKQHLLQRISWARRAVSTPNPGTSSSRWRPDGYSERGSTCAPAQRLGPCSPSNSIHRVRSSCLAELATHFRRSSRIPSTPTSSTITTRLTPATHR